MPKLNAILATCPTVAGTLTCKRLNGVKNLVDQTSTTSCAETATAVENVIAEFTEPGGRAEDVGSPAAGPRTLALSSTPSLKLHVPPA